MAITIAKTNVSVTKANFYGEVKELLTDNYTWSGGDDDGASDGILEVAATTDEDGTTTSAYTRFYLSDTMYFTLTDATSLAFTDKYGNTQSVTFSTYNNMRLSKCGDTMAISVATGTSSLTAYDNTFSFIVSTITYNGASYPCVIYSTGASGNGISSTYRVVYLFSYLRSGANTFHMPFPNSTVGTVNSVYGTLLAQMIDPLLDSTAINNVYLPIYVNSTGVAFTLNDVEYMNCTYLCIGGA
ncbi:MAG: hypothetical protein LUD19_01995 [Clostridia bacterium]|nr:hypothetical protein [Clostridia bacterium]